MPRLDLLLFQRGLVPSREKAQALILAGQVLVDHQKSDKPGRNVGEQAQVELLGQVKYVSRGGLKLEAALDHFRVDPTGLVCLDVGVSTGGFTDCLLQRGARKVHAVDVGASQMNWTLRQDARIQLHEHCNARHLTPQQLGEPIHLAVCDVSFISVTLMLEKIAACLQPPGKMIILVKPQFEVGREQVGKGGIVKDPALHEMACERVATEARRWGFTLDLIPCPVRGAEGNREFLLYAHR